MIADLEIHDLRNLMPVLSAQFKHILESLCPRDYQSYPQTRDWNDQAYYYYQSDEQHVWAVRFRLMQTVTCLSNWTYLNLPNHLAFYIRWRCTMTEGATFSKKTAFSFTIDIIWILLCMDKYDWPMPRSSNIGNGTVCERNISRFECRNWSANTSSKCCRFPSYKIHFRIGQPLDDNWGRIRQHNGRNIFHRQIRWSDEILNQQLQVELLLLNWPPCVIRSTSGKIATISS